MAEAAVLEAAVPLEAGDCMTELTDQDRKKISDAITAAEIKTSGELVVVIARASDPYTYIPLIWPPVLTLAAMVITALAGLSLNDPDVQAGLAILLIVTLLLSRISAVKRRLVPSHVRRHRAALMARAQFLEQNLHLTRAHTGVLIFVSLAEHYVEILADKGINDLVDPGIWNDTVARFVSEVKAGRLTPGLEMIIIECGTILAKHCPSDPDDENELPNRVIEI